MELTRRVAIPMILLSADARCQVEQHNDHANYDSPRNKHRRRCVIQMNLRVEPRQLNQQHGF